eukprot:TRINITY_DN58719_c0_g1_i2.p1 TRINITY_DN58719_c0_g1~~TRINITY_DN58719_c0_g1_i2.p1  ORF type:complete len:115 (+),score=3.28 TRINITY_DN58719_c0_g1_i2:32-376(+)
MARMKPSELLQRSKGRKTAQRASFLSIPCLAWSICVFSIMGFVLYLIQSRLVSPELSSKKGMSVNVPFMVNVKTVGGVILLRVKAEDCLVEVARFLQQWCVAWLGRLSDLVSFS